MSREEEVRLMAHNIWEQEGRCDGHDCEHWLKAEMIWEERQRTESAATATGAKSAQIARLVKKGRPAAQKH
jgi:hypothetical protein